MYHLGWLMGSYPATPNPLESLMPKGFSKIADFIVEQFCRTVCGTVPPADWVKLGVTVQRRQHRLPNLHSIELPIVVTGNRNHPINNLKFSRVHQGMQVTAQQHPFSVVSTPAPFGTQVSRLQG